MHEYERRTNSHDLEQLALLIAKDATYWFSDGSYTGRAAVLNAIGKTFETIQDETYSIADIEVVGEESDLVALRYAFSWSGSWTDLRARGVGVKRTSTYVGMAGGSCSTNTSARRSSAWSESASRSPTTSRIRSAAAIISRRRRSSRRIEQPSIVKDLRTDVLVNCIARDEIHVAPEQLRQFVLELEKCEPQLSSGLEFV